MAAPYKPDGYTSVAPYLIVDGAERTIRFLEQAFGGRELRRFDAPDGGIMHAEVRIDDTVIMLGDSGPGFPPVGAHVHVYVRMWTRRTGRPWRRARRLAEGGGGADAANTNCWRSSRSS